MLRGNPEDEAKTWAKRLAEVDRKRSGFQDLAAEGSSLSRNSERNSTHSRKPARWHAQSSMPWHPGANAWRPARGMLRPL